MSPFFLPTMRETFFEWNHFISYTAPPPSNNKILTHRLKELWQKIRYLKTAIFELVPSGTCSVVLQFIQGQGHSTLKCLISKLSYSPEDSQLPKNVHPQKTKRGHARQKGMRPHSNTKTVTSLIILYQDTNIMIPLHCNEYFFKIV